MGDGLERLEREICAVVRDRLGRECVYVPSARLGLYLALRSWVRPGGRLLMAGVNDDVILFVVLAAGLRPVLAPASVADGNIDVDALTDDLWERVDAVLTTNVYGLPDRVTALRDRCRRRGIPLLEDAAHALLTTVDGRPVGTFGDAAVFSFSKHTQAMGGGILATGDPDRARELVKLRDELLTPATRRRSLVNAAKPVARDLIRRTGLTWPVWRAMRALGMIERESGYRMDLRPPELSAAVAAAPDLVAFDQWIRVDLPDYRMRHDGVMLRGILRRLRAQERLAPRRLEGVRRLAELASASSAIRSDPQPVFRVPLLVSDRDAVIAALERHGIVSGYVYDPPLDAFAGTRFADPDPLPARARWFARHVLPADPMQADRTLRGLRAIGAAPARWTGADE